MKEEQERKGRKQPLLHLPANTGDSAIALPVLSKGEKLKTFLPTLTCYKALPICKPISVGRTGDLRYTTPSHHPTTPSEKDIGQTRLCKQSDQMPECGI